MLEELLKVHRVQDSELTLPCVDAQGRRAVYEFLKKCAKTKQPVFMCDLLSRAKPRNVPLIHYTIAKRLSVLLPREAESFIYPCTLVEQEVPLFLKDMKDYNKVRTQTTTNSMFAFQRAYTLKDYEQVFSIAGVNNCFAEGSGELVTTSGDMHRVIAWNISIPLYITARESLARAEYVFVEQQTNTKPGVIEEFCTCLKFSHNKLKYEGHATIVRTTKDTKITVKFDSKGEIIKSDIDEKPILPQKILGTMCLPKKARLDYFGIINAFARATESSAPEKLSEPTTAFPLLRYQSAV